MDIYREYGREFLSPDENMGEVDVIRSAYKRLNNLKTDSEKDIEKWTHAWSEILSAISEKNVRAYFSMTRDTRDKSAEEEFTRLANEVIPLVEELDEVAKKRFVSLPEEWVPDKLSIAKKKAEWQIEIYRKENLPLISKNINLQKEYNKITGGWETEFEGETVTPQQLNPYLESPDRKLRERAWHAKIGMHLNDYDRLNELFDEMMEIRKEIAENAGLSDYVAYQYKKYGRLSYNREDAEKFRNSIHKFVVPAVVKIVERRREMMNLDEFHPWDTITDPSGANPPVIYDTIDELKEKTAKVLGSVDEKFSEAFKLMDEKGYLDLENRQGKAPGAYMNTLHEERISLIFANSVGTSRDFDTLIHECGHAMHGFLARHLPYQARKAPIEFAEVASMSLELLARPHWDIVYTEEEKERIGTKQLEDTLIFLPFMAMLDEFQEWVYTSEDGESAEKRAEYWRTLNDKYRPYLNYESLDSEEGLGWQYPHIFTAPLYYIEYGIAQVGALQVYKRSLSNYDKTVEDYKYALSLGNTVSLPELFNSVGIKFVMNYTDVLKEVVGVVMKKVGLE